MKSKIDLSVHKEVQNCLQSSQYKNCSFLFETFWGKNKVVRTFTPCLTNKNTLTSVNFPKLVFKFWLFYKKNSSKTPQERLKEENCLSQIKILLEPKKIVMICFCSRKRCRCLHVTKKKRHYLVLRRQLKFHEFSRPKIRNKRLSAIGYNLHTNSCYALWVCPTLSVTKF